MKYAEVIYVDDIEKLLGVMETFVLEDIEADAELKIALESFLYKMEKYLKNESPKTKIIDLRLLEEKKHFFPKR